MTATADSHSSISVAYGPVAKEPEALTSWAVFRNVAFRDPRTWVQIAVLSVTSVGLALLVPWPTKIIVDNIIGAEPFSARLQQFIEILPILDGPKRMLAFLAAMSIVAVLLHAWIDALLTMRSVRLSQGMVFSLASTIFSHLQRRSLTFHARTPVGDSLSRITGDTWSVDTLTNRMILGPFQTLLSVLGAGYILAQIDAQLALLVLLIAPLTVAASLALGGQVRSAAKAQREVQANLQSHLQRTLSSMLIVQGFVQEQRQSRIFRAFADDAIRIQRRSTLLGGLNELATGLVTACGGAIVLWMAARSVHDGELSLGALLIFVAYFQIVQTQLKALAGVYGAVQQANAGLDRVAEVLRDQPEIADVPEAPPLGRVHGSIELLDVNAGYDDSLTVLRNVSLSIAPGEIVALIGPSGAGKSTLASLLPRFLDPWSGSVAIDGRDLREVTLRSVRQSVAVVPQEPLLMATSIAENIAFGKPDATHEEVVSAANSAEAHDFIMQLEDRYLTVIGERGASLSGGQRQRIAIARALVTDAPILVLDEPTSALDPETEAAFVETLRSLRGHRTILLIAHRMSTAAVADRVVVLRAGGIVAEGSPGTILSRGTLTDDADWTQEGTA
jgi:ATP-binding cassette subfamily B protein/subfamily B ATP-binding cassette protein MsbA